MHRARPLCRPTNPSRIRFIVRRLSIIPTFIHRVTPATFIHRVPPATFRPQSRLARLGRRSRLCLLPGNRQCKGRTREFSRLDPRDFRPRQTLMETEALSLRRCPPLRLRHCPVAKSAPSGLKTPARLWLPLRPPSSPPTTQGRPAWKSKSTTWTGTFPTLIKARARGGWEAGGTGLWWARSTGWTAAWGRLRVRNLRARLSTNWRGSMPNW